MQSVNRIIALLFTLSLFFCAAFVHSQTVQPLENNHSTLAAVKQKLFDLLGENTQFSVEPYNNELRLVTTQNHTFFASPDGKYLYLGQVIDTESKIDLTELVKQQQRVTLIKTLPRDALLSYQASNEQHVITIFTDIDCPFCRKLHENIDELNRQGITIDYVMIPRGKVGSSAFEKTAAALCARNPQEAMNQAMQVGHYQGNVTNVCENNLVTQQQLAQRFGFSATPTILLQNGEAISGLIKTDELLQRLADI